MRRARHGAASPLLLHVRPPPPPLLLLLLLLCVPWPEGPDGAAADTPCPAGCACHLESYGRFSSYSQTRVDCSRARLLAFPAALPLAATHLSLAGNRLGPTVSPGGPGYTTLLALNLSGNGVRRLLAGSFSRLRYLDALDLSRNAVERVDAGAFHRAPLSVIDLSRNALASGLDLRAFRSDLPVIGNQGLSLDLSHNRVSRLELTAAAGGGGGATLHVRSLNLAANALAEAPPPELLRHLPELRHLTLDSNPIARLGDSAFGHLRELACLSLRGLAPGVRFSRSTFAGLERTLRALDLSDNCRAGGDLPEVELGDLAALVELRLSVSDDRSPAELPAALGLPAAGAWKCWRPAESGGGGGGRGEVAGCVAAACYRFLPRDTL